MSVQSIILQAGKSAILAVPAFEKLLVSRKLPLRPDYVPGFAMLELTEILLDEPTHGEGRIGRNPSSGIQRNDALMTALLSSYAETEEQDETFRDGVIGVATNFANSETLRSISHRYWMSRVRFFPLLNNGRPEIQALCEFRVLFKTNPNRPGVAIHTR